MMLFTFVLSLSSCALVEPLIIRRSTTTTPTTSQTTPTPNTTTKSKFSTSTTTNTNQDGKYYVIFECNNGNRFEQLTESKITKPENPTKNYAEFVGWYTDEELTKEFDFSKSINQNTILYAKYNIDYKQLTNAISTKTIKANVQVNHINQRSVFSTTKKSIGSGEVIYSTVNNYYVLTNHHVIYPDDGYDIQYSKYNIEDAYGQVYDNVKVVYKDVDYDLALLEVEKENYSKVPEILTLADNVYLNSEIVAIGEPHAQNNTITYGSIKMWYNFSAEPETVHQSNINFKVIAHDAKIQSGSSGGALLDTNLNLVGVNFASVTINNKEYSCAISIYKVKEFLTLAEQELKIGII